MECYFCRVDKKLYLHFSLCVGKVPGDEVALSELNLKLGAKIMMMGTREEEIVSSLHKSFLVRIYSWLFDSKIHRN